MPDAPIQGIDVPVALPPPLTPVVSDAPAGGASRGGNAPDDGSRARRLRALAVEIESIPSTHAALSRLLAVAVETVQGAGAWVGLTMEDTDALVVVSAYGDVGVDAGARVPRDRAFAARALSAHSAVFADPSTGVRWNDTVIARVPVRAVAAALRVDETHPLGVISIIGGPGRLFTVADGAFVNELGALATQALRRREAPRRALVITDETAIPTESNAAVRMLLDAAAAASVDDFALAMVARLDEPSFLGVSLALCDRNNNTVRFPAATGALSTLRGVRTPMDSAQMEQLARLRRPLRMPDARHVVPEGWRSLVPALPGASVALVDGETAIGRIDLVFDPDHDVPDGAIRRIEQQSTMLARAITVLQARIGRAPPDQASESLAHLRSTLAARLHDLTSPIAGISALAELLVDEELSPELLELVLLIQRSASRASDTARNLRELADDAERPREPISVTSVVADILRERADSQRALAITVTVAIDPALPPVHWPATCMRDFVASAIVASETALLGSARRRIDIRGSIEGGLAVLTVADDGAPIGIVASEAELYGATVSVIRTDDGRTIRRLAIPLRIGALHHP